MWVYVYNIVQLVYNILTLRNVNIVLVVGLRAIVTVGCRKFLLCQDYFVWTETCVSLGSGDGFDRAPIEPPNDQFREVSGYSVDVQ